MPPTYLRQWLINKNFQNGHKGTDIYNTMYVFG